MTPAIELAKRQKIKHQIHQYEHDATATSFGLEAAEKLAVEPAKIFKTLVVETDKQQLAVGIVPVNTKLNLKKLAKALKTKKVVMASVAKVENSTGYLLGGVSPLGQKKALVTVLDESAEQFATIYTSAGRRGLEIELSPADLLNLTRGKLANIC